MDGFALVIKDWRIEMNKTTAECAHHIGEGRRVEGEGIEAKSVLQNPNWNEWFNEWNGKIVTKSLPRNEGEKKLVYHLQMSTSIVANELDEA